MIEKNKKNEIKSVQKEYDDKISQIKLKYEKEIDELTKENQDLKLRLNRMLEEYQTNLKDKDSGTKKVRFFL